MRRVTTQDIAKQAGVSQSTVSFILNNSQKASISEETRSRVLRVADELGYIHKSSQKKYNKALKDVIAVVVPNMLYPYYPSLVEIIEKHAVLRGYTILLCNLDSPESENYYIELLSDYSVKGIIFTFTPNTYNIINAIQGKVPAVLLGEKDENIQLDTIALNSMAAGNILVDHLHEMGHRTIAFVSNPSESISRATRRRLEGVRVRMEQLGLKNQLIQVFNEEYKNIDALDGILTSSYDLTKRLINQSPEVTAIISTDDITCIGIVNALRDIGKNIPDDIALCSFDDTDISRILYPNITSIDHGSHIRVKFAFDLLIDRINNPNKTGRAYKTESEPNLIVRASTLKR